MPDRDTIIHIPHRTNSNARLHIRISIKRIKHRTPDTRPVGVRAVSSSLVRPLRDAHAAKPARGHTRPFWRGAILPVRHRRDRSCAYSTRPP